MNVISGLYHWLINICCALCLYLQATEKKAPKSEIKKGNSVPLIHTT